MVISVNNIPPPLTTMASHDNNGRGCPTRWHARAENIGPATTRLPCGVALQQCSAGTPAAGLPHVPPTLTEYPSHIDYYRWSCVFAHRSRRSQLFIYKSLFFSFALITIAVVTNSIVVKNRYNLINV